MLRLTPSSTPKLYHPPSNSRSLPVSPRMRFGQIPARMDEAAFRGSIIPALYDVTNLIIPHTSTLSHVESKTLSSDEAAIAVKGAKWVIFKVHLFLINGSISVTSLCGCWSLLSSGLSTDVFTAGESTPPQCSVTADITGQ